MLFLAKCKTPDSDGDVTWFTCSFKTYECSSFKFNRRINAHVPLGCFLTEAECNTACEEVKNADKLLYGEV